MTTARGHQLELFDVGEMPEIVGGYPMMRYMGSKFRLLPWIHSVLQELDFDQALDGFSGSGCVGYLLKAMGKEVCSSDFLNFPTVIATATIENPGVTLTPDEVELLLAHDPKHRRFIETTFNGIFFTTEDLRFLDRVSWNLPKLGNRYKQAIAASAMIRALRETAATGVFTVAGDPDRYKDDRRDLRMSIEEHFLEHVDVYNAAVFNNGRSNRAIRSDIFSVGSSFDLVYLDPPYVPRSDDNCYMKRYHFLEGLSCYWNNVEIMETSRVKKISKPFTPFSYRRTAIEAFDRMFASFADSTIVLSYSSNGYPDLTQLKEMLGRYKGTVDVHQRSHRYHFGTHSKASRNQVVEYLIVGQ